MPPVVVQAKGSIEKEWDQCLQVIDKFEDRLDGLRKNGFTLITGLLSADAVIGQVKETTISPPVKLAVMSSTVLLIVALRVLDKNYQMYQKVASDRARTLEIGLEYKLERDIGYTYRARRMWRYVQWLYYLFVVASSFLGIFIFLDDPLFIPGALIVPVLALLYIWKTEPQTRFFSYGSDMDLDQMRFRLGHSKIKRQHGILRGYILKFNKLSDRYPGTAYANIEPHEGSLVEGVLYDVSQSDWSKLDTYEGYPYHYERIDISVELDNGRVVEAQAYIANPRKVEEGIKPTEEYLAHLLAAHDILSPNYYRKLKDTETSESKLSSQ